MVAVACVAGAVTLNFVPTDALCARGGGAFEGSGGAAGAFVGTLDAGGAGAVLASARSRVLSGCAAAAVAFGSVWGTASAWGAASLADQ